ncbi:MAG TPA: hypothetical protein VFG50_11660 [Rhodothermales bacterium]|nr:hypothetical protein [Rhodothermales bacterium]
MKNKRHTYWTACWICAVVLSILTFTPLVSAGEAAPYIAGIPHALWAGILVTIGFIVLTYVGSRVHPMAEEEGDQ